MSSETLVHRAEVELNGDRYEILVYSRDDGRFFARTSFAADDIIIHDGPTLEEVLARHEKVLSLAVSSRNVLQMVKPGTFKDRQKPM